MADTVHREIRVQVGQRVGAVHLAAADLQADKLAGAEDIGLRHRAGHHQFIHRGETGAEQQGAGRFFLHREIDVHLVGALGHRRGLDVHFLEILGAVDARLRQLDLRGVVIRALELPKFAPHHLIARLGVAGHVDAPDVDPPAGIHHDGERDGALVLVDLRHRAGVGERVALVAQPVGDRLGRLGQPLAREHLARLDADQLLQLLARQQHLPVELDLGDGVFLALRDVDGDVDIFLVGCDRNLRRLDGEIEVAAVLVVGLQGFQVRAQALLRVLVELGVPGQPAGRAQHELVEQLGFAEGLRADDIDGADLRHLVLGHDDADADAVAFQRRDGGLHIRRIPPFRQVLAL